MLSVGGSGSFFFVPSELNSGFILLLRVDGKESERGYRTCRFGCQQDGGFGGVTNY